MSHDDAREIAAWLCVECGEWLGDRLPLYDGDHVCRGPHGGGPTADWRPE